MSTERFATKEDFECGRKLVGFRVKVDANTFTVEQSGVVSIEKDPRNGDLRSMYGNIFWVELGVLRLQAASEQCFQGYLVDYAENEAEAEKAAIAAALAKRNQYINELQVKLNKFQNLVLTKIIKTKCDC